jgi:hypothetical protein
LICGDVNFIYALSSDISSVKDELKINQKALFEFLKEKLSEIDNSLLSLL